MSFYSWLQNVRFALAPSRGKHPNRRPGSHRATLYRPTLEALEARLTFSFSPAMSFSIGPNPQAVVTGDFNNDGRLDLAVANHDNRTVGVLLGDGLGGFGAARQSAVGTIGPVSLAVADFNHDGKLDLAVISQDPVGSVWNSSMSVLLGNGDGTFRAPTYPGSTWAPLSAAAGDFNADGNIDLVVGEDDWEGAGYVEVLLGNGQGGFTAAKGEYSAHSLPAPSLAVGDLNGDGKLDAVMVDGIGWVFMGHGDGTFPQNGFDDDEFVTGPDPRAVAIGDFTGDGIPDLISAGQTVDVLRGHGDGWFDDPISHTANGANHTGVAAADFNGDGKLDAVTADADTGTVSLLLGNGNGTLTFAGAYGVGSSPSAITAGDFNGDGRPDVAAANAGSNTVSVLLNDGNWDGSPPSIAVTIAADNGAGSLRQAISDANKPPSTPDNIVFQLTAGPQTIRPASPLPDVTDPLTVSVDATQHPWVVLPPLSAWQNNSSLRLSGTGSLTIVGGLEGSGNLALDAASNLTAGHILQSALVIGGTAGSPAVVTIAPSDASGNPLSAAVSLFAQPQMVGSVSDSTAFAAKDLPSISSSSERAVLGASQFVATERQAAATSSRSNIADQLQNDPKGLLLNGRHAATAPPLFTGAPNRPEIARLIAIAKQFHPNAVAALMGKSNDWLFFDVAPMDNNKSASPKK